MNKYINADEFIKLFRPFCYSDSQIKEKIDEMPGADVAEVKYGEWINHFDDLFPAESTQECSVCHHEQGRDLLDDNFCPNCGADMRGELK